MPVPDRPVTMTFRADRPAEEKWIAEWPVPDEWRGYPGVLDNQAEGGPVIRASGPNVEAAFRELVEAIGYVAIMVHA